MELALFIIIFYKQFAPTEQILNYCKLIAWQNILLKNITPDWTSSIFFIGTNSLLLRSKY